jgi:hypothetical protein
VIDLIAPREPKASRPVHADWQLWMDESVYTHAEARREPFTKDWSLTDE